ncbi:MAG TPA: acyltransferase [Polyangiaceae bacterium]
MKPATIPQLPSLDGLRGLAVLGVLLFHADKLLVGGYLGVDLFFVLSGFLITSILLVEYEASSRIDLRRFWVRRARRLFPALLSLMPAIAVYARVFAKPQELAGLRQDGLATLAYVSNWRSIFAQRSYWDLFAAPSPLEHTWSLAIEVQFYVLWPFVVVGVFRLFKERTRALFVVSLALAAVSAAAMVWLYDPANTSRAYLGTDTRVTSILLGAAAAAVLRPSDDLRTVRGIDVLGLVAGVGIGVAWWRLEGQSAFLYHGGFWLTELAVLVLIACAVQGPRSLVARALTFPPFVWAGLVSYGIYLWHWPIFAVLDAERVHWTGWRLTLLRFAVTLAVAYVSYHLLEQPIRKRGVPKPWLVVPGAVTVAVLCIVLSTRARAGTAPDDLHVFPAAGTVRPSTRRVLVVGDSVATALGSRLHAVQSKEDAVVAERGIGDCSILDGIVPTRSLTDVPHDGGNCGAKWTADVAELHPDVTLVVLGGGFFARVQIGEEWQRPCQVGWHDAYVKELIVLLRGLAPNGGRPIVVRAPYPVGTWKTPGVEDRVDCFNAALDEAVAAVPGVTTLDLVGHLCPGRECALSADGAPIRPDGMHFEGPGADVTARWVLEEVR